MGKCSECGRKYPFLRGYTDNGKHYCPECFHHKERGIIVNKEQSKNIVKKEEDKKVKLKENRGIFLRGLNLIVLIIVLFLSGFGILSLWISGVDWFYDSYYTSEDYTYCIDSCVSDIDHCVFSDVSYDNQKNAWVEWDNYESCSLDLESCVLDCELDYESGK